MTTETIIHVPTVLFVEDEERLRRTLLSMAEALAFPARGAVSGEEALRLVREDASIGVVVIDLNLPGMHGLELFERLAEMERGVEVVVLTGFGDLEAAQRSIRLGVTDFLTKPCHLGELEAALQKARRRLERSAAESVKPALRDVEPREAPAGETLAAVERRHILAALKRHGGNRRATAEELGISLRTLYYRLEAYGERGE